MPELTKSTNIYKYISTRPIINFSCIKLENPLEKLKEIKIKIIKFDN